VSGYPHQSSGRDHDSVGLFQQRPSQGWGSVGQLMDPGYAATTFLRSLVQVPGWQREPLWRAAKSVQRDADGTAYAPWAALGTAVAGTITPTSPNECATRRITFRCGRAWPGAG